MFISIKYQKYQNLTKLDQFQSYIRRQTVKRKMRTASYIASEKGGKSLEYGQKSR